jgi:hypothetical protein
LRPVEVGLENRELRRRLPRSSGRPSPVAKFTAACSPVVGKERCGGDAFRRDNQKDSVLSGHGDCFHIPYVVDNVRKRNFQRFTAFCIGKLQRQ